MLHKLCDVLAEQGERWIGRDDVGLLEERDALGAAEVAARESLGALEGDPGGLISL